jgi:hypothetical protein
MKPDVCPHCGAIVPDDARACPECGSDEETGWSDRAQAQRLDLPDDEFDYDEFVKKELDPKSSAAPKVKPAGLGWVWWIAGILLVVALVYGLLRQLL